MSSIQHIQSKSYNVRDKLLSNRDKLFSGEFFSAINARSLNSNI